MHADSAETLYQHALEVLDSSAADAVPRGMQVLAEASARGSGAAHAKLAHFTALGIGDMPDWDKSLDMLVEAAERGFEPAEQELRALSKLDAGDARTLRAAIDIRALIAPRQTQVVSESPRMRASQGFLAPKECAWMIQTGAARLDRAKVFDNMKAGMRIVDERSNSDAEFRGLDIGTAMVLLQTRISNTIGLPRPHFEPPHVLHYAPGQLFAPHHDYFDLALPGLREEIALRGQRLATFLIYLNDTYEGGETDFPGLNLRHKGRAGDAFVFANVDPALTPDPRTQHAGLPPTSGEKWLFSQWIRSQPAT